MRKTTRNSDAGNNVCKLLPFLIFKLKTCPKTPKSEKLFPDDVLIQNQEKGWMTESLMLDWLRNVWERHPGGLSNLPSMLVWTHFVIISPTT